MVTDEALATKLVSLRKAREDLLKSLYATDGAIQLVVALIEESKVVAEETTTNG